MFKNILIPTDGSPVSQKAIEAGIKFAKVHGAKVTGLFAAPPATPMIYANFLPVGYGTTAEHARAIEKTAQKNLSVIEAAAKKAGLRCEVVHVTSDFPAETIVDMAKKKRCDCIFMASHGRKGIAKALLGSQTQKVIATAPIPVLIYR
jgi:nucleotide-binding universal stress UspA family protein